MTSLSFLSNLAFTAAQIPGLICHLQLLSTSLPVIKSHRLPSLILLGQIAKANKTVKIISDIQVISWEFYMLKFYSTIPYVCCAFLVTDSWPILQLSETTVLPDSYLG
jgi:hypothetical protein